MINLIKKYKYAIIAVLCAVAVLTAAFFAGESIDKDTKTSTADSATASETVTTLESSTSAVTTESTANSSSADKAENTTATATESTKSTQPATLQNSTVNTQPATKATQSTTGGKKDKYQTEEVPAGKPQPVEPQEQETNDNTLKCTFSISCATVLDNTELLPSSKKSIIPDDGWILKPTSATFNEGESVFDVLESVCRENKIHLEFSLTPIYNSAYIEGIGNLYEFDCGSLSGWNYTVNDWFPNYGCSRYEVKNGDVIKFLYTCNLGEDIGGQNVLGE